MENEYKSYKLKKKINPMLKMFCTGVGIFLCVMWTSFIWLPKNQEEFQVTQLNVPIKEPNTNRILTITRWDYSESDKTMEVQMRIENRNYDGRNKYTWSAVDRHKGSLQVESVYADEEMLVVQIKKVPSSWSIISLRIALAGSDPDTEYLYKLYGNATNVQSVEHIKTLDKNGYYVLDINSNISFYKNQIINLEKNITETKEKIGEINGTVDLKSKELQYMTDQELNVAMAEIKSLESMKEEYYQDIAAFENTILEYNQRILNLQEKIKTYQ